MRCIIRRHSPASTLLRVHTPLALVWPFSCGRSWYASQPEHLPCPLAQASSCCAQVVPPREAGEGCLLWPVFCLYLCPLPLPEAHLPALPRLPGRGQNLPRDGSLFAAPVQPMVLIARIRGDWPRYFLQEWPFPSVSHLRTRTPRPTQGSR